MSWIRFITYTLNGMRVVLNKSIFQMHKSKLICMQTAESLLWTRLESVIIFFGWTSFTNVLANQTTCQTNNTISQLWGNFPVFRWCGAHRLGRRRVVQRTWSFGSERAFGCSPPPVRCSHPDRGCMCVCVSWLRPVCSRCEALMSESGNGTATLRSPSIPHWAVSPLADGALLRALLFPIITSPRHRWKRQSALTGPGSCHCLRPPPLST